MPALQSQPQLITLEQYTALYIQVNERCFKKNGYGYNPEIAGLWFEEICRYSK